MNHWPGTTEIWKGTFRRPGEMSELMLFSNKYDKKYIIHKLICFTWPLGNIYEKLQTSNIILVKYFRHFY